MTEYRAMLSNSPGKWLAIATPDDVPDDAIIQHRDDDGEWLAYEPITADDLIESIEDHLSLAYVEIGQLKDLLREHKEISN